MVAFLSSFSCGGGSQSFSARIVGHTEDVKGTIDINVRGIFLNQTSWGAMATLRTWKYSVREVPGATTIATAQVVQILGGPGFGTLTIDSYKSWSALLAELSVERVYSVSGLVAGRLRFMLQP